MSKKDILRKFMKTNFVNQYEGDSDQDKGVPQPIIEDLPKKGNVIIDLPKKDKSILKYDNIDLCIDKRKSRRNFNEEPLSIDQLSYLLWATAQIKEVIPAYARTGKASIRNTPSAGGRQAFDTYLTINKVDNLTPGLYRYLAMSHRLEFIKPLTLAESEQLLNKITLDQKYCGKAQVMFIWVCKAYLGEWRYALEAHKLMLLDVGHICQNLYLACEALGIGAVAIGAYDQQGFDNFIELDGEEEFTTYLASVGACKTSD